MHDRRDRIEKRQIVPAGQFDDVARQRGRGQRTGRDDGVSPPRESVPILRRTTGHLAAFERHQGMAFQRSGHRRGETVAIDGQGAAGRDPVGVGAVQDQRVGAAHFVMQQTDGIVIAIVGAKRIRTDQFGALLGAMGIGGARRAHFMEDDRHAVRGQLPGRLAAGQTGADDVNRGHGALFRKARRWDDPIGWRCISSGRETGKHPARSRRAIA